MENDEIVAAILAVGSPAATPEEKVGQFFQILDTLRKVARDRQNSPSSRNY